MSYDDGGFEKTSVAVSFSARTKRQFSLLQRTIAKARWWHLKYFLCSSRKLGKWSNLTNVVQLGWNHQLVNFYRKRCWLEKISCCNAKSTLWKRLLSRSGVDPCRGWLWCSVEDQPGQWQSLPCQREGTSPKNTMKWGWSETNPAFFCLWHIFLNEAWKT